MLAIKRGELNCLNCLPASSDGDLDSPIGTLDKAISPDTEFTSGGQLWTKWNEQRTSNSQQWRAKKKKEKSKTLT